MKMVAVKKLIWILFPVVLLSSCLNNYVETDSSKIAAENETAILDYAKKNSLNLVKESNTGIYYRKTVTNPNGATPSNATNLWVTYTISNLKDSVIYSKKTVDSVIINPNYSTSYIAGFLYSLSLLKEGERGQFFIPSAYAYGSNPPTGTVLGKDEAIILDIQLVHLITESEQIRNYIAKKKLVVNEITADSLRFIRLNAPVVGDSLKTGDVLSIKYSGMYLSETVFDSGTFTYTVGANNLIVGFYEGLSKMKKGEKAKLIFPSTIGYGTTGSGAIKPYTPLMFDVEILTVNGN